MMLRHQPIVVTPRPVAPPDLGDTRWRRFFDVILFRRKLRQKLTMTRDELYGAYLEVEAANDRRTEGASAAHEGMFKIERLGIVSSDVSIRKQRMMHERIAVVDVIDMDSQVQDLFYNRETVSFEGQCYIVKDVSVQGRGDYLSDLTDQIITLTLQGVVLNETG
jgi:hypothetical protein